MNLGRTIGAVLTIAVMLALPALGGPPSVDAAAMALHAGNASNAVALATQALADPSLTPRDRARVLVDRGLAHEMLGERDAALADLTEAIDSRTLPAPEQAKALYDRGVALDELNRTADAAADYSGAIALLPGFAAALNNRGNAYRRLGRMSEARADYLASIAAGNPHPEYPNYGLGQIAEGAGQLEEARNYYRAALAANPQFALAAERLHAIGDAPPPPTPVVLTPPPGAADVHLRPPPGAIVHLKPPGSAKPIAQAQTEPGLKPALSEGAGQTIQLGAWRNEADAVAAWNRITAVGGSLLAGLAPQVVPADIPGKGRYYRLRAGMVAAGGAPKLCAALVAKGLACMVVKD